MASENLEKECLGPVRSYGVENIINDMGCSLYGTMQKGCVIYQSIHFKSTHATIMIQQCV